jgi:hypothetical protein
MAGAGGGMWALDTLSVAGVETDSLGHYLPPRQHGVAGYST